MFVFVGESTVQMWIGRLLSLSSSDPDSIGPILYSRLFSTYHTITRSACTKSKQTGSSVESF
jgi:hypothetical protein